MAAEKKDIKFNFRFLISVTIVNNNDDDDDDKSRYISKRNNTLTNLITANLFFPHYSAFLLAEADRSVT